VGAIAGNEDRSEEQSFPIRQTRLLMQREAGIGSLLRRRGSGLGHRLKILPGGEGSPGSELEGRFPRRGEFRLRSFASRDIAERIGDDFDLFGVQSGKERETEDALAGALGVRQRAFGNAEGGIGGLKV